MTWKHVSRYRSEIMGAACVWVMIFHGFFKWPEMLKPVETFFSWGNAGVEIFLIVSGIGLFYSYTGHSGNVWQFYARRYTRILIPYLLLGIPYYLWYCQMYEKDFWRCLTQVAFFEEGLRTTWYVTAIAFFYLIFPLIYLLQDTERLPWKRKPESGTVTLLLCIGFWLLYRFLNVHAHDFFVNTEVALARLPVFVLGCELGRTVKKEKPISQTAVLGALSCILILIYCFYDEVKPNGAWTRMLNMPLAISMILVLTWIFDMLSKVRAGAWVRAAFRFFGERSLELYLIHVMVINIWCYYSREMSGNRWRIRYYALIFVVSVALAAVVHPLFGWIVKKLQPGKKKKQEAA